MDVAIPHDLRRGALNRDEKGSALRRFSAPSGLVRNRNSVHGRVSCSIWTLRPSWQSKLPDAPGVTRRCRYACGPMVEYERSLDQGFTTQDT